MLNEKIRKMLRNIILLIITFTVFFMVFGYESKDWNGLTKEEDDTFIKKCFNRFYFSTITFTTIGYGDIYPKTIQLKSILLIYSLFIVIPLYNYILN
jgi:hypothetical protein